MFIVLASFLALLVFIQTKSFGNLVTKVVSDISRRRFQTEVKIKKFSLSVFPPGLELNRVSIKKKISDVENFEAELGKIGLYISLIEIEEKKLTFGEIRVSDSDVHYVFPKKDEELKEIDRGLIEKVFKYSDRSPIGIDTLLIENTRLFANHELLEARRFKVFKKNKAFMARVHLSNLQPSGDSPVKIDELWADAEITPTDIHIHRLKVLHDVQTVLLKGSIQNYYKLKGSEAHINGEAQLYLDSINQEFELPELIKIKKGIVRSTFTVNYKDEKLATNLDLNLSNFRSSLFYADDLTARINLENSKLSLESLELRYKEEFVKLLKEVEVADLRSKKFLTKPITASAQNLTLANALRILPSLKPLRGRLTGELTFQYKNGDLFFTPKDNFIVNDLGLFVGAKKDPFKILQIKRAKLSHSQFAVVSNEFQMSASVELPRSKFEVDGFVNKNRVQFHTPDGHIDLEDFGNISNLDIKGAGELSVNVTGPLSETVINIKGKTKGFEILGYKLDETEKDISIALGESSVIINKMESRYGKTSLSGNGTVNYGESELALGINSNDANYQDLSQILYPIFKNIDFLPQDLDFKAKVDVDIFGKYKLDQLKIRSKVNFSDLTAYGENINSGSFDISLLNQVLFFKDLYANKGRGLIHGDFQFGIKDKSMKLNYAWENLDLTTFNFHKRLGLNIKSTLSGDIKGSGTTKDYLLKLNTTAFNTRTQSYTFEDSAVTLNIRPERISGKTNLLGSTITSDFNLALRAALASDVKFKLQSASLKPLMVAFFGQHLENEDFDGRVFFEGSTTFQNGFNNLDLTGSLRELIFSHSDFSINYSSTKPDFIVKDSVIQRWNLNIYEKDLRVSTQGEGVFGKRVKLVHNLDLNSKIVEILIAPILSAEGFTSNSVIVEGQGTDFDFAVSSRSDKLDLTIDRLPIPINDLKYDISFSKSHLSIQNLSTLLDTGLFSAKGDVFFDENYPDVNLKFVFDKAEIPILGKSSMNVSGEGIILGNTPPYNLSGDMVVNRAQIVNELNEFSNKSSAFAQVRFLPKSQESAVGKLLNLNVNVKAETPVRITNSLMDVALNGEVRLLGSPNRPRGEGHLSAPAGSSRIFFKNSEYLITRADITFSPKKEISNPDFDVQAMTYISTYKVYPKAYGDLERFNFDVTSEPTLSRSSILSLIAFGYTNENRIDLNSKDQQNLNSVGVGSFVFDRFKISDILNKQFGLQINLGTVIEQSATDSLLTGRSQEGVTGQGGNAVGRTRSATKIELRKRLDEATTLSVSSTMGGTIGQRQSMNLTYGINKNVQLEGVYEKRNTPAANEDIIYDSYGGDIKFRGTFK